MVLVSVIVPVYNVEKYLHQCVKSLLKQSLLDMEIIFVNDGSTDSSLQILNEFVASDHRVKVISKSNTGYGDSMNIGIAQAVGEYIGIVESDDYILPCMFEDLYQIAKKNNVDVVKSNFYSVYGDKEQYTENLSKVPYNEIFSPTERKEIFSVLPSIWSGLYKREFLEKENILFHTSPGASYQDVSFWFKVMLSAKKMICVPEAYLCYRCDNENSSVKSPKKVFCIMDEFQIIKNYIVEKHMEFIFPLIVKEQFIHYRGNYFRLASIYKYAFLDRMRAEFIQYDKKGFLDKSLWADDNWKIIQKIIQDADSYFEMTNIDYLNKYAYKTYTINHQLDEIGAKYIIREAKKIIIYGAGIYGHKILEGIQKIKDVYAFAVTEKDDCTPNKIKGIPVYTIDDLQKYNDEAGVIVAMKKCNQLPVLKKLKMLDFHMVISVDKY